ncbi:MAG: tyrosine--tRNA ligase, partial [Terracidiphilus sp.]
EKLTEVRYNSEWLGKLGYEDTIRLTAHFTVSQMLERDEFHKRFQAEQPISLHELLYPVMQGYDSVKLECDVELGGTDQKFNLMCGRELQRHYGQKPQIVLMTPILEGLDGVQKMSKSLGNAIGINEPPAEMYGKLMSISDELMGKYWVFLTDLKQSEIDALHADIASGKLHPMEAKKRLARTITASFHGEAAAQTAADNWAKMFQQKASDLEGLEEAPVKAHHFWIDSEMRRGRVAKLLTLAGLAESVADADRKIKAGAVKIDGNVVNQTHIEIPSGTKLTIRVGKRAKVVHMYSPAVGDRVTIDYRGGLYEVVSATYGALATIRLLDNQGNPTDFTEQAPPGDLSPA